MGLSVSLAGGVKRGWKKMADVGLLGELVQEIVTPRRREMFSPGSSTEKSCFGKT